MKLQLIGQPIGNFKACHFSISQRDFRSRNDGLLLKKLYFQVHRLQIFSIVVVSIASIPERRST